MGEGCDWANRGHRVVGGLPAVRAEGRTGGGRGGCCRHARLLLLMPAEVGGHKHPIGEECPRAGPVAARSSSIICEESHYASGVFFCCDGWIEDETPTVKSILI